jgi:DNA adenine methylase
MALISGFFPTARPFLRWIGGKQKLLPELLRFLPEDLMSRTYYEPFVGAGSLFFSVAPNRAYLCDANSHLISAYTFVRDSPEEVSQFLETLMSNDSCEHYYSVREQYNKSGATAERAARFIYLNRTCFNGIFRVNTQGEFNVPYGRKRNPPHPSLEALKTASQVLQRAELRAEPFSEVLPKVESGSFIYLDPPYPPLNGTSYFTHYTSDRFPEEQQHQLAHMCHELSTRGCSIMMTNADTPLIRSLYEPFRLHTLPVIRWVTCKRHKHAVSEVVITNYEPVGMVGSDK